MTHYRKKPVVVEAMQFFDDAEELMAIQNWMDMDLTVSYADKNDPKLKIETLEGVMNATIGDYIIKGVNGEFYPCKPDIFEKTYEAAHKDKDLSFGDAVRELKNGNMVARKGWNGKGMFVFMQVPATIGKQIVPNMQSLPQSVKDKFDQTFNSASDQIDAIYYSNQLAIVKPSNIINGWAPSVSDALADDWYVVK